MKQLLLAEDEPMLLTSMLEIDWKSIGVEQVYAASSGIEAVELLNRHPIDVIVTDIRMPGMSGLEVCEYAHNNSPRTKCIILSGYSDFAFAQQAIRNQVVNYLIKPIKDEELIETVAQTFEAIAKEWEIVSSSERAHYTLRQNLPLLRANLLNELLSGTTYSEQVFTEKLRVYELPAVTDHSFNMIMVRLEKWYNESQSSYLNLFEFSIINIIEELLGDDFELWNCKDNLGYLVCLLVPKHQGSDSEALLRRLSNQVQNCIKNYLNGEVSVLVSYKLIIDELVTIYRTMLSQFRQLPKSNSGFFIQIQEYTAITEIASIRQLHTPPSLMQLLEAERFDSAKDKIIAVFEEMLTNKLDNEERMLEVTTSFYSAFAYNAQLRGISMVDLIDDDWSNNPEVFLVKSTLNQVKAYSLGMVDRLKDLSSQDTKEVHALLKQKVHQFIEDRISYDTSLQAIGDHVGLHPAYLSGVYKQLTGENISDYIYRYRLEKSRYLLRSTDMKIYEIAQHLGFQNAPYFSKIFKHHHGLTPQEYRDKI